jgi:Cytochrome c7 and related cytochrome c
MQYQQTNNPNHTTAGFPTTCQSCHTTTAWTGATFNHTWFSITHGNAQGVCATCHTNSSDYSVFQCTQCHTAAATNPRHNGIRGYVFNSINCYSCHP